MLDILPFRTAYVPIRPHLVLNENPSNIFDKFPPSNNGREHYYNSIFKAARLNASVFERETSGQCLWVNNSNVCTGIFGMIMKNELDTSFIPSGFDPFRSYQLFSPLLFGMIFIPFGITLYLFQIQLDDRYICCFL